MKVEQNGKKWIVSWRHVRNGDEARGGKTVCIVRSLNSDRSYSDEAFCSEQDNYNKNVGRKISMQRVLNSNFMKPQREAFWNQYRQEIGI